MAEFHSDSIRNGDQRVEQIGKCQRNDEIIDHHSTRHVTTREGEQDQAVDASSYKEGKYRQKHKTLIDIEKQMRDVTKHAILEGSDGAHHFRRTRLSMPFQRDATEHAHVQSISS